MAVKDAISSQAGFFGQAAFRNANTSRWVNQFPYLRGVDAQNAVSLFTISPYGTYAAITATRSSDNLGPRGHNIIADACIAADDNRLVPHRVWCRYEHGIVAADSAYYQHINDENSIWNRSKYVYIDPFKANPSGSTYNLRLDSGTGIQNQPAFPVSAALHITGNGGTYGAGIVFAASSLHADGATVPSAIEYGPLQANSYYDGPSNVAWKTYLGEKDGSPYVIEGVGDVRIGPTKDTALALRGGANPTISAKRGKLLFTDKGLTIGVGGRGGSEIIARDALVDGSGVRKSLDGTTYVVPANTSLVRFFQKMSVDRQILVLPTTAPDGLAIQFSNYTAAIRSLSFAPAIFGWSNGSELPPFTGVRARWDAIDKSWYVEK